jgi:hypothetical protein
VAERPPELLGERIEIGQMSPRSGVRLRRCLTSELCLRHQGTEPDQPSHVELTPADLGNPLRAYSGHERSLHGGGSHRPRVLHGIATHAAQVARQLIRGSLPTELQGLAPLRGPEVEGNIGPTLLMKAPESNE